jgi:3-hydroxyisobutyrate dehydrogenase
MGYPMAGHLSLNKDLNLVVHNRTAHVSKNWMKEYKGSKLDIRNPIDIQFDGLITCLKDDAAIIDVLINKKLILSLKKNAFIIDHSTTSLDLIKIIVTNNEIIDKNISFYDAPVSGGEVGAINGSLSAMIGGPKNNFATIKRLMRSYSKSIVHIGPNGHGQLTKMVNQLCIAGLIQGLSEGIALGMASELNMNKVFDGISNGAAQSWQMDNRFKTMIKDKFNFGFAVDLMIKDLKISLKESKLKNLDLDVGKAVLKKYQKLSTQGDGKLDTSSLIKLLSE